MSEGLELLLVLVALYLFECVIWIRNGTAAFVSPWRLKWRIVTCRSLFGNDRGGALVLNPLLPLSRVFLCHLSPISLSPAGICNYTVQTFPGVTRSDGAGESLAFEEIEKVSTDGDFLIVNCKRFARCATQNQAESLSRLIHEAAHATPAQRDSLIRNHNLRQYDDHAFAEAIRGMTGHEVSLQGAGTLMFVMIFGLFPVLAHYKGLVTVIIPMLLLTILFALFVALKYRQSHLALHPERSRERWLSLVKMVLCPVSAIRAGDILAQQGAAEFSPVVAAHMLRASDSEKFICLFMRAMKYPLKSNLHEERAAEIVTWHNAQHRALALEYLRDRCDMPEAEVFAPPPKSDDVISYCPRCDAQFNTLPNECPDCPGVAVQPYTAGDVSGDCGRV